MDTEKTAPNTEVASQGVEDKEENVLSKFMSLQSEIRICDQKNDARFQKLEGNFRAIESRLEKMDDFLDAVRDSAGAVSLSSQDSFESIPGVVYDPRGRLSLPDTFSTSNSTVIYFVKFDGLNLGEDLDEMMSPIIRRRELDMRMRNFFVETLSMPLQLALSLQMSDFQTDVGSSFPNASPKEKKNDHKQKPYVIVTFDRSSDVETIKEYRKVAKHEGYRIKDYEVLRKDLDDKQRNMKKQWRLTAG